MTKTISKLIVVLGFASLAACGAGLQQQPQTPSPDYHGPVTNNTSGFAKQVGTFGNAH